MNRKKEGGQSLFRIDISDDDIYEAMKDIPGYLDITPGDLKEIYFHAYRHAFDRITCSVKVGDIMTREVHTAFKDTPLGDVAEIMAKNEISGVPVIDKSRYVLGVISEKDFSSHMGEFGTKSIMSIVANCINTEGCLAMTIRKQRAEDIMTSPAITMHQDATLGEVAAMLTGNNINRIPVVDHEECLIGIVSRADVVRISFQKPNLES